MNRKNKHILAIILSTALVCNTFGLYKASVNDLKGVNNYVSANAVPINSGNISVSTKIDNEGYTLYYSIDSKQNTAVVIGCSTYNDSLNINIDDTVTISNNKYKVIGIGNAAFQNQKYLNFLKIGKNVSYIGDNAFSECTKLSYFYQLLGDDGAYALKKIGGYAFYNCSSLNCDSFSDVQSIGAHAFENCSQLSNINLLKVNEIGEGAFKKSGINEINIMQCDGLSRIPKEAFSGCENLWKVHLPEKLVTIDKKAFSDCTALDYIYLPDSVKFINAEAFKNDISLETVLMPAELTEIGSQAFMGCESMEYIVFKNSYTTFSGINNAGWITANKKINRFVVWGNNNGKRNTAKAFAESNGFEYRDINTDSIKVLDESKKDFVDSIKDNVWNRPNEIKYWSINDKYAYSDKLKDFYMHDGISKDSEAKGVCSGLAILSVLSQNGYFNINDYKYALKLDRYYKDKINLSTFDYASNGIKPLIYFVTTCWSRQDRNVSYTGGDISWGKNYKELIKYAEYMSYGADKAALSYATKKGNGHTVVCEGLEYRSDSKKALCWEDIPKEYDARFLIYDNNFTQFLDNCCIYINTATGDWYLPIDGYKNQGLNMNFRPGSLLNDSSIKTYQDVTNLLNDIVKVIYTLT